MAIEAYFKRKRDAKRFAKELEDRGIQYQIREESRRRIVVVFESKGCIDELRGIYREILFDKKNGEVKK